MKKISNFLSIILTLIMVISIIPMSAITSNAYVYSGECGDNVTWSYNTSTYTLTISGTGDMYDYSYNNRPWESYEDDIKTVVINNGVTTIGDWAFYDCDSLTSVTIPDSVTTIGDYAFCGCDSLASVTIPDSVTNIGNGAYLHTAYYNNANNWENDVLYIDEYLINAKRSISGNREIKDETRIIADKAFEFCESLTGITIPDSVTIVGNDAFAHCYGLTSVTIPDSVTIIGNDAFSYCSNLVSVIIGESVTIIGIQAFYSCFKLTSIMVDENNEKFSSDEYGVLYNNDKTTLIQYPIGKTGTSYTIPDSVITIGDLAFFHCSLITSVTIGDSVTTIGNDAFSYCSNLESVTIGDSVTTIGNGAFYECQSLASVTIPDGVTTIGDWTFFLCPSLTSVTIPDSVTTIGDYAFIDCSNLTDVFYGGTEAQWKKISIGSYNEDLTDATIHYNYHIHEYDSVVTVPTCTKDGYTTYTCECGDTYMKNMISATGHEDLDVDAHCDHCDELLCDHDCHRGGITGFFWKITNFFNKIFGSNKTCSCGVAHY